MSSAADLSTSGSTQLDVRIHFDPRLPLVRLVGELDLASAHLLADALDATGAAAHRADLVVLDLAGLTFCDLAGLRALEACSLNLEAAGKRLMLYHAPRMVTRLIELSGVARGIELR